MTSSAPLVPRPRPPRPRRCATRRWYEDELGWPVTGSPGPPELITGVRFDALRLPDDAGLPLLARTPDTGPVLRAGGDLWLLTATGTAAEVPGVLRWLEWGALAAELGLAAVGEGGRLPAPPPQEPGRRDPAAARRGPREAAAWLRPPAPGREGGRPLPALLVGGHGEAPDLVRLVDAAATECHRALLRRVRRGMTPSASACPTCAAATGQALAFS